MFYDVFVSFLACLYLLSFTFFKSFWDIFLRLNYARNLGDDFVAHA